MTNIDDVFAAIPDAQAITVDDSVDFVIDSNLRVISIPVRGVVLGVEGDKDVNRVTFLMPKMYKGVDLSQFEIRINYANANCEKNFFKVTEITVANDQIRFVWVVGADAVAYMGNVEFVVRFVKLNGSTVAQELNTTLATAKSLIGLSVDGEITPVQREDLLAHFYSEIDIYSEQKKNEILGSIPNNYIELSEKVDNLNRGGLNLKEDFIENQINGWLDNHPEATTTVQDGVIGEKKIETSFLPHIKNDYVTPQMFGAKGDGITDDTNAFQRLNGKTVYIPEGVYIVSSVIYSNSTRIRGAGIGKATIKQALNCNKDMITFVDAPNSELIDVLLLGRDNDTNENKSIHTYEWQSLLKIRSYKNNLHGCRFAHIRIMWASNIGLYIGSETENFPNAKKYNWVYQFDDIRIEYCRKYCLYESSSDNRFSNFYLSEGGKACFFSNGVENMYLNFKIDQPYGTYKYEQDGSDENYGNIEGKDDGAAIIITGSRSQYINFDIQSPYLIGLKMYTAFNTLLNGNFDNSGYTNLTDGTSVIIQDCVDCELNCIIKMSSKVTANPKYDVKILGNSENVSCYTRGTTGENQNDNPTTCFITDVSKTETSNYNTTFFLDRPLTNNFPSPLLENFSTDYYNKIKVEQDNTNKVVGTTSVKFVPTDGIRATFSSKIKNLMPNAIFLVACEVVITETGKKQNEGFYIAMEHVIHTNHYCIKSKSQGKYVCMLVGKSSDDGTVTIHFSCNSDDMIAYLGNVLLYRLSGNLLDSKLQPRIYNEMYTYLEQNIGTEFGTLTYREKITNNDVVCAIKRLMGQ